MEINSNNLIDINTLNQKKYEKIDPKNANEEKLKEVCDDFEAFFINQIMNVSLKETKIAGEAAGSDIVKSMYIQSISDNSAGSMGISSMLFEYLSQNNKLK